MPCVLLGFGLFSRVNGYKSTNTFVSWFYSYVYLIRRTYVDDDFFFRIGEIRVPLSTYCTRTWGKKVSWMENIIQGSNQRSNESKNIAKNWRKNLAAGRIRRVLRANNADYYIPAYTYVIWLNKSWFLCRISRRISENSWNRMKNCKFFPTLDRYICLEGWFGQVIWQIYDRRGFNWQVKLRTLFEDTIFQKFSHGGKYFELQNFWCSSSKIFLGNFLR